MVARPRSLALAAALWAAVACGDPTQPRPGTIGAWPTASPASQGLDSAVLEVFAARAEGGDFGMVQAVVIVRNGYLVFERYFLGAHPDAAVPVYSVTKSVTSLLVGIARERGFLGDLDAPVLGYFPEYPVVEHPGGDKGLITLEHLLQMRTGLAWDEWSVPYTEPQNPTTLLAQSSDWIKHVLDLPMAAAPGTTFEYNSGVSVLLGGVLRNATGRSAADFAAEALLEPLGIESAEWQVGPDDVTNTAWGLRLSARDMARVGYLVIVRGEWNGRRIVPDEWLDASIVPYTEFPGGQGYGYHWWVGEPVDVRDRSVRPVSARGWGDQYIVAVPGTGLALAAVCHNFEESRLTPAILAAVAADAITQ